MAGDLLKSARDVHRASHQGPFLPFPFYERRDRMRPVDLLKRYSYWVQRCVQINARVAAAVPYCLYSKSKSMRGVKMHGRECKAASPEVLRYLRGRGAIKPSPDLRKAVQGITDDLTEIPTHPLLDLLSTPNQWVDGHAFREAMFSDLQWAGRSYTHITDDEMWRIMPHICEVIPDEQEFVRAFRIGGDGPERKDLPPEEVLWIRQYDPGDPWGGLGAVEAWIRTVDAGVHIQEYWSWIFERGGSPDFVLKSEVAQTTEQKQAITSEWRRWFSRMAHRVRNLMFLGGKGADIVRLGMTNKELEFSTSADQIRDHIGQALGVPKSKLTTDDVNRANARESDEAHMGDTIWPLIQLVEGALNMQLVRRKFGDGLILVHENPVPGDQNLRLEARGRMLATGSTVDEVRIEDGQEPLGTPEAQEVLVGAGFTTLTLAVKPPDPFALGGGGGASRTMFSGGGTGGGGSRDLQDQSASEGDDAPSLPTQSELNRSVVAFELSKACHAGTLPRPAAAGQLISLGYLEADIDLILGALPALPAPALVLRKSVEQVSLSSIWRDMHMGRLNGHDRCNKAIDQPTDVPPGLAAELRAVMREQFEAISEAMASSQDAAFQSMSDPEWVQRLIDAMRPHLEEVLVAGGERGVGLLPSTRGAGLAFDVKNPKVQEFIDRYVIRLATEINGTTHVLLTDLVGKGLSQGASVKQIADAIMDLDDSVSAYRATMIARTESTRANMAGTQEAWQQSGVVAGKRWLLAPNACQFCEAAAAVYADKAVPVDQPFYAQGAVLQGTQGGVMRLDYSNVDGPPLHPHCRCDLIPVLT